VNRAAQKNENNFLLLCPRRDTDITWEEQKDKIKLKKINNGTLDRLFRRLFGKPGTTTIDLDLFGSEVWKMCNGRTTVKDIGRRLEEKFGDEIKPTYPRLVEFIRILHAGEFVEIPGK